MKKMLAVLPLMVCLVSAIASAQTQPHWRVYLLADNGYGTNAMGAATVGVYSSAGDGFGTDGTASDGQDAHSVVPVLQNATRGVLPVFGNKTYHKDVKSPRLPDDPAYSTGQPGPNDSTFGTYPYEAKTKIWDLRVFCLPTNGVYTTNILRLSFQIIQSSLLPPAMLDGKAVKYSLRMVDNKGKADAPANGTIWDIPIPRGGATGTTWHSITLPNLVISAANNDAIMAEGYRMQFIQELSPLSPLPIPEPSSILALASGLMGLAGYAIRRRK